jgi:hypothetical protein
MLAIALSLLVAYSNALALPSEDDASSVLSAATAASPSAVGDVGNSTSNAFSPEQRFRWLQEENKRTELIGLVVAMILALLIVLFFIRTNVEHTAEQVMRACGLVLVIFSTLFIAVYASTSDQLTAPIGILGAIAGYLFGSAQYRTPKLAAGGKEQIK